MTAEQGSPTTEAGRHEPYVTWPSRCRECRGLWPCDYERGRQQALTDAIAAVRVVSNDSGLYARPNGLPLIPVVGTAAVIDTLTRLRDGSEEATRP